MSLQTQERATYDEMWALDSYNNYAPGEKFVDVFAALAPAPAVVLDAGTGSGKGFTALVDKGYSVFGCDITKSGLPDHLKPLVIETCLWHDLHPVAYLAAVARVLPHGQQRFDYVYCCDVLEHIP